MPVIDLNHERVYNEIEQLNSAVARRTRGDITAAKMRFLLRRHLCSALQHLDDLEEGPPKIPA